MLCSSVKDCIDIDELRSAIRQVDNEIIVTGTGPFSAHVVKIELHRLWMQRIDDTLPRAWHVEMAHPRVAIGFSATAGPPMRRQGIELRSNDVAVFSRTDPVWHVTAGPSQFATMSLPTGDLAELDAALAGQTIMLPSAMTARAAPARIERLRWLHAAAVNLAEHSPEIITNPHAARGLEASLTEAMVACLAGGRMQVDTACQRRYALVIKRLCELEEANRDRPLYLPEVCKVVGVSSRSLYQICYEMLGISPKRYLYLRRLHLVHRELREAIPGRNKITQIATNYGFWELGRFAVAYRETFGQTPSKTLRQK